MMNEYFGNVDVFAGSLRDCIEQIRVENHVEQFSCTIEAAYEVVSEIHSGRRHSKAPAQVLSVVTTRFQGRLVDGASFSVEYTGLSVPDFLHSYRDARMLSVALRHNPVLERQSKYPKVDLASDDLQNLLSGATGCARVDELTLTLERMAADVTHPRLIAREVRTSVGANKRYYFDSALNNVSEFSIVCELSLAFMLSDSIESHSDSFGRIPSLEDIAQVVNDAARNITLHEVRDYCAEPNTLVLLSPKALVSLVVDAILPNLSARAILDGTSAWDVESIGEVVLPGVTLRDNPLLPFSPYSKTFDAEGVPTRALDILDSGELVHPLLTATLLSEFREAVPNSVNTFALTGHSAGGSETSYTNLTVDVAGRKAESFAEMVEGVPACVVVNNLTGASIDPLTGQFALDAEGARVYKEGKLAYSTSITLRGNFFEAVSDPANLVGPAERVLNIHAPSLRTRVLSCVSKQMAQED